MQDDNQRCRPWFGVLALVLASVLVYGGAIAAETAQRDSWAAAYDFPPAEEVVAQGCGHPDEEVRALTDPANPYRDDYIELDYWCYAHAATEDNGLMVQYKSGTLGKGARLIKVGVDENGLIIPMLELARLRFAEEHGEVNSGTTVSCIPKYKAVGVPPAGVYGIYEREMCRVWAEYLPEVPAWLAAAPPRLALLMPGGDVVVYGALGGGAEATELPGRERLGQEPWTRYGPEGNLLGSVAAGTEWYELFFPAASQLRKNYTLVERGGYILVYESPGWTGLVDVFDFRGEPGGLGEMEAWGAPPLYDTVPGRYLMIIHALQQRQ